MLYTAWLSTVHHRYPLIITFSNYMHSHKTGSHCTFLHWWYTQCTSIVHVCTSCTRSTYVESENGEGSGKWPYKSKNTKTERLIINSSSSMDGEERLTYLWLSWKLSKEPKKWLESPALSIFTNQHGSYYSTEHLNGIQSATWPPLKWSHGIGS